MQGQKHIENIDKNLMQQEKKEQNKNLNLSQKFKKTLWTSIVRFTLKKTT